MTALQSIFSYMRQTNEINRSPSAYFHRVQYCANFSKFFLHLLNTDLTVARPQWMPYSDSDDDDEPISGNVAISVHQTVYLFI